VRQQRIRRNQHDVLATEIMDDLQTALEQFALIAADLDPNRLALTP
jgi:hypothetical protein